MAKIFQKQEDLIREEIAMRSFANKYNLLYQKLDEFDIDFAVYNSSKKLIAYAEVKGRNRNIKDA